MLQQWYIVSDPFILSPKAYEAVTGRKEVKDKDKDTPIAYKGYFYCLALTKPVGR